MEHKKLFIKPLKQIFHMTDKKVNVVGIFTKNTPTMNSLKSKIKHKVNTQ